MAEVLQDTKTTIETQNPTFRSVVAGGALDVLPKYLEEEGLDSRHVFIITDSNVLPLHGKRVARILDEASIQNTTLVMPAGEQHKTIDQVERFIYELAEARATRKDPIMALGGGVVGDLGGFVASIYNRNVPAIQVPTTLLAMVDSSIGGKNGIDLGGKNKTGRIEQPRLIVADPLVLETLDQRVYTEGFGEIAKYGMLDADLLPEIEAQAAQVRKFSPDNAAKLGEIIARSVRQKIEVIAADPFEMNPEGGRVFLNYGHTLGHGLEAGGDYSELLHGEAVAIGMIYAGQLAVREGLADEGLVDRLAALLQELRLPTTYSGAASIEKILANIAKDKKNESTTYTRFVLPRSIGHMVVHQVDNKTVGETVSEFVLTGQVAQ